MKTLFEKFMDSPVKTTNNIHKWTDDGEEQVSSNEKLLELWRDDDHVCASLSVFNVRGRIKKSYTWTKPYRFIALEIWDDNGNIVCSFDIKDITNVKRISENSRDMIVTMKDGSKINLR